MKKTTAFIMAAAMTLTAHTNAFALAEGAASACLISESTGEVLFEKGMDERRPMASTTKIMTAITAIENCGVDEVVTVSKNAHDQEGSSAYIEENMQLTMLDLLYGLLLNSGNDAAVAIAEHISGSSDEFVKLMNKKAKEIGADNTHFVNPNGLPNDDHYTTASDLAKIAAYAMKNDVFREIVGTAVYTAQPLNSASPLPFYNHNKLLTSYDGATGVKTGYTEKAGRCLVSAAKRNDMEFVAVTLNDNSDWQEHTQMFDFAFAEYYPIKIVEENSVYKVAQIEKRSYNMIAAEDFVAPLKVNGGVDIEVVTHMASNLKPPINRGEKTGYLEIKNGDTVLGTVDLISQSAIIPDGDMVMKDSLYSSFMRIVRNVTI